MPFLNSRQTHQSSSGILFAEDFDDDEDIQRLKSNSAASIDIAPPESVPAHYTACELEAAQQKGYLQGHVAALAELAGQREASLAATCAQIAERLVLGDQGMAIVVERAAESTAKLLFEILLSMLPTLAKRHDAAEIVALVHSVIVEMTQDIAMCVAVVPDMIDEIRAALTALPPNLARRVVIAGQDGLLAGDARLSWSGGTAVRSSSRMQQAITDILIQCELLEPATPLAFTKRQSWQRGLPTTTPATPNVHQELEKIDG